MKKQNNKGYSLVELMVAVAVLLIVMAELGALMVNSQKIYSNGMYEVDVQEEAQQVLQVVGDMMANANKSIERTPYEHNGIKTDKIVIVTDVMKLNDDGTPMVSGDTTVYESNVTYEIGLAFDVMSTGLSLPNGELVRDASDFGSATHKYDTLIMKRTSGADVQYIPLAEGVKSIRLLAQDEKEGDVVTKTFKVGYDYQDQLTLQISMQNEQYAYNSSIDVYLRNQIGSGGPPVNSIYTTNVDGDLNVRRIHIYHLADEFPGYHYFRWKDTGDARYDFTGDTEDGLAPDVKKDPDIKCGAGFLADDSAYCDEVIMQASKSSDMSNPIDIRICTEAVYVPKMPLYNMNTTATGEGGMGMLNTFSVRGICVCKTCCKHEMEAQFTAKMPIGRTIQSSNGSANGKTVAKVTMFDSAGGYVGLAEDPAGISNVTTTDSDGNTIVVGPYVNVQFNFTTARNAPGDSISMDTATNGGNNNCTLVFTDGTECTYTFLQQCKGDFTYDCKVTNDTNAVILKCSTANTTGMGSYWNFVDVFDGYMRVAVKLTYHEPGHDDHDDLELFGYYYPSVDYAYGSDGGVGYTNAQHNKLWNLMLGTSTDKAYSYVATAEPAILRANVEAIDMGTSVLSDGVTTVFNYRLQNSGTAKAKTIDIYIPKLTAPSGNFIKNVTCVSGGVTASYADGKIHLSSPTGLDVGAELDVKLSFEEALPGEIASTISTSTIKINIPYGGISYVGNGFNGTILQNAAGDQVVIVCYGGTSVQLNKVNWAGSYGSGSTYAEAIAVLDSIGFSGITLEAP